MSNEAGEGDNKYTKRVLGIDANECSGNSRYTMLHSNKENFLTSPTGRYFDGNEGLNIHQEDQHQIFHN